MSKNLSVKRTLFTGTLLLTAAGILSRFIGFFYKIFLSRTIGAEGLGIYQLIFPVMALCFSLTSAGIQTSVSRFVSSEIGKQNPAGARFYLLIGLILSVCLSVFTGLFMWNLLPRQRKQDQKQPLPHRLLLQEQLPPPALLPILSLFSSDESQISGLRRSIPAPET